MAALGAIDNATFFNALKEMGTPFKSESKALGGTKKVVTEVVKKELSTPLGDLSSFFAGIDKSLINLVVFAKKSFGLQEEEQKREDKKFVGPMPSNKMKIRTGEETLVDTDNEIPEKKENVIGSILDTLKNSFQEVSFGEKMTALLMTGGLLLFLKYKEEIIQALIPVVEFLKGVVDVLGVKGTLMTLFGIIVGIKLLPVIIAAKDIVKYLGTFLPSFKTLKRAFRLMRVFLMRTLPRQLASAYSGSKGGFTKALKLLSKAFLAMRVFMTATLVPALMGMVTSMMTVLAPILVPLGVIVLIAAGIAAVLFSLKSGFDTFKQSLEDGDSMLLAIGKGIADFALTLVTLPLTLIKKLIGFIAGLFGFDGIKESLDKFSFKDFIKNSFMGLIKNFAKVIKAIAMGAGAALAAIAPGGKTPQAEFSRVYNEIMEGGAGQSKIEKTDLEAADTKSQPELTENEVAKAIDKGEIQAIKKGSLADGFIGSNAPPDAFDYFDDGILDDHFADSNIKKSKLLKEQADMSKRLMLEENQNRALRKGSIEGINAQINSNNPNTTNIKNETHTSGDLDPNNNEAIQRVINSMGNAFAN